MKLLVIVPYRNREAHLKEFIPYITKTLTDQNIDNKIVVVEQSPEKLFNRGLLCNIGFSLYQKECDYICIHDVDIIGENFDYGYEPVVTHLSARWKNKDYKEFYPRCLGGVVIFPKEDFIKVNGFSNEYWGWGAEDDDLKTRCDTLNIITKRKQGRFYSLPHDRIEWKDRLAKSPGFENNRIRLLGFNALSTEDRINIIKNDGLSNLHTKYSVIKNMDKDNYVLTKVKI